MKCTLVHMIFYTYKQVESVINYFSLNYFFSELASSVASFVCDNLLKVASNTHW